MARQGLMDDSGYMGFEECSNYECCTNDFVAELLEPYNVESIEELASDSYNKGKVDGYNQALEDMKKGIKEILEDNAIYNIDCIDTLISQLSK